MLAGGQVVLELLSYQHDNYGQGVLPGSLDTQANLVVVLARQRSYLGNLFHHSVIGQLLETCPVPVLVLPVDAPSLPPRLTWCLSAFRPPTDISHA